MNPPWQFLSDYGLDVLPFVEPPTERGIMEGTATYVETEGNECGKLVASEGDFDLLIDAVLESNEVINQHHTSLNLGDD
jgi:hypothetical protein